VPSGINFSVFSSNATSCTLVLFQKGEQRPFAEIPFPPEFRMGDVFAMMVFDLDPHEIEYGYRMDGPFNPHAGHRFDRRHVLLDPFARAVGGRAVFCSPPRKADIFPHRGRIPENNFDWGHDRPLDFPVSNLVIYEMHVRGFTRHASSGVAQPGTFDGLREKIPHLVELGINCVELMPIFEFDEHENFRKNPDTGEPLCNYWGYSTLAFRAPKAGFAARGHEGQEVNELKELVKSLHAAGIQVILDVVFNHTAEGDASGPVISFRGLDNKTYYLLAPNGDYLNFSGCGNTLDCNHPVVRDFVLDCLRYWAAEYHIDGFRFDLASVLGRDSQGHPLPNPPLLESIAHDPVLAHCELIAEAWDAGGLYQVGNFPSYGRWMEWNGKYRDAARRFLRGDDDSVGEMVQRIMGSPDLYQASGRKPSASVNFVTCHDGFTLADLFAYETKYNLENGESNADGGNDNWSWNCGTEGPTTDPDINALRLRCAKNAMTLLMVSQGVPMLYMGDEVGRTQRGNNNAYCHDTPWNWLDWDLAARNEGLLRFTRLLIASIMRTFRGKASSRASRTGVSSVTPWLSCFAANTTMRSGAKVNSFTRRSTCTPNRSISCCRSCLPAGVGICWPTPPGRRRRTSMSAAGNRDCRPIRISRSSRKAACSASGARTLPMAAVSGRHFHPRIPILCSGPWKSSAAAWPGFRSGWVCGRGVFRSA
jgi:glycogen operon protein